MSDRKRLPNKLPCQLIYVTAIGRFPNGEIAEVFLNSEKGGTQVASSDRDAVIVAGIALHYGALAETIRGALSQDSHGRGWALSALP
jgi:hypothetical protein